MHIPENIPANVVSYICTANWCHEWCLACVPDGFGDDHQDVYEGGQHRNSFTVLARIPIKRLN